MADEDGFDAARHKAIERRGYNAAARRYAVGAAARHALTQATLAAADLQPGAKVLDLASGPGTLALEAAQRIGNSGLAVASDLAESALGEACAAASAASLSNVVASAADAERLPFRDGSFDRALCGLGLMFFPDAAAALGETRRVLQDGGRVALSVWGAEHEVPLVACALACIRRNLPPPRTARLSVFRLGDAARLGQILSGAGFDDVVVSPVRLVTRFSTPAEYWQAFLDLAGGAAYSLAQLPDEVRSRLAADVAQDLAPHRTESGYTLISTALVATARAGAPGARRV